jgi:tRNA pseudouridine13 synthase
MARELVKGRPEEALRLFLGTASSWDRSRDKYVKRVIGERWGDWEGLSRRMHASPYGKILGHLGRYPDDFWGAVGCMQRSLRAFQLFSYQSYVWNLSVQSYLRARVRPEQLFLVPYICGDLDFFHELAAPLREELRRLTIPLVGPELEVEDPHVEAAVRSALAQEEVTRADFDLPERCGGFFKAEPRAACFFPRGLCASEPFEDDRNPDRLAVEVRFELPRGAYGTLVVKRLFRRAIV